jgi:alpha/beta superfamily hydrolase
LCLLISIKCRDAVRWLDWRSFSELAAVLGYFFGAITAFTAVVALAVGLFNIAAEVNGPRRQPHSNARTVMVEVQRHLPLAKEAAKDVSPGVAIAKTDTKKIKHYKPKVFARQRDNYGYWNARGYAQRGLFFR